MGGSSAKTKKILNFKPEEIKAYLKTFKRLVLDDQYTISQNGRREENIQFIEDYKIDSKKEKEILMNIEFDDFCYAVNNKKPKFSHEILYVFNKEYELDRWGELKSVEIYIKTNKTETRSGDDIMIIVSFHERNKPIKYLFK